MEGGRAIVIVGLERLCTLSAYRAVVLVALCKLLLDAVLGASDVVC